MLRVKLRKTIFQEYFETLPKSMGHLKKHQRQKRNEMATEYNKLLLEYDTYYKLKDQTYFYIFHTIS
jgi:hypothetical protein